MTEPMYRTPAGTQTETTDDGACDRCGRPRGRFNQKIQGRDPEQRATTLNGKAPRHCHRCTVAIISGTDPLAKRGEGDIAPESYISTCGECGAPMLPGKGKRQPRECGDRCRKARYRRETR